MLLFVLDSVHIVTGWSIHSHPHTRWSSQSQTFHTFLSYLYVYLSKSEYVSQSNLCVYNTQIMSNCWRARSPMGGTMVIMEQTSCSLLSYLMSSKLQGIITTCINLCREVLFIQKSCSSTFLKGTQRVFTGKTRIEGLRDRPFRNHY